MPSLVQKRYITLMSKMYTKNFSFEELNCKCEACISLINDQQMSVLFMLKLQAVRDELCMPMKITSGHRCKAHNASVGGSVDSYHVSGRAADVQSLGLTYNSDLIHIASRVGLNGVIIYKNFIHLDDRLYSDRILLRGSY